MFYTAPHLPLVGAQGAFTETERERERERENASTKPLRIREDLGPCSCESASFDLCLATLHRHRGRIVPTPTHPVTRRVSRYVTAGGASHNGAQQTGPNPLFSFAFGA